jgi:ketosteroid isomerase-like protein
VATGCRGVALCDDCKDRWQVRKKVDMADIRSKLIGLCEAFNAHDLDRIMTYFADDCVLEMPRGPHAWGARFEGRQAVRQALASRFEGLPDVHYGNEEHFVDTDRQTGMTKWMLTGTTREGRCLEVSGCDFYTFRNDQVTRKDSYWKIIEPVSK